MPSGKIIKLILYELLQFAAFTIPTFVIMERFAKILRDIKGGDHTVYWLVVAVSIAYVTLVTLLVWVPLKYLILKKRRFCTEITQWRPTALAYILLSTLPCFAILIASSKVQVNNGVRPDPFTELPVSLVLMSLICVDIIERIRPCKIRGQSDSLDPDLDMSGPILTHLEQVTTVTGQLHPDEVPNGVSQTDPEASNGSVPRKRQEPPRPASRMMTTSRATSTAYLRSSSPSSRPRAYSGPLRVLWRRDMRAEVFVDSFLFWMDTVEMVRVAGEPSVFFSLWVFPVYILAFISTFRMVITPQSPLLSFAGVALQDLPFFIIRVALIVVFNFVTPLLYPLKNVMVTLTFIYFTYLTRLSIFKRQSLF